jgi:hypothetical protein
MDGSYRRVSLTDLVEAAEEIVGTHEDLLTAAAVYVGYPGI